MPSTYSTLLRLEKQADGENTGTWGGIANTVFDLLEESIASTASIATTGGDTTLTTNNGSSDEARKKVIVVTGTLTSDANLIIPNLSKTYWILNSTSGAFDVNIKTSGGSAVVVGGAVLRGFYCDGSNVVTELLSGHTHTVSNISDAGALASLDTVDTAQIDNDAVESAKIAADAIIAEHLAAAALGMSLINGTIDASVATNALTVALKTQAGSDATATDPILAPLRNATLTDGDYSLASIEAAISVTVPSGATMGTVDSQEGRLWLLLIDDGGTYRIGITNRRTSEGTEGLPLHGITDATLISAGADSAGVVYADATVSAKPYIVIGYVEWLTALSTAGTWSAAPDIELLADRHTAMPGQALTTLWANKTDTQTIATQTFTDITGLSVSLDVQSAANQVLVRADLSIGADSRTASMRLVRGSTTLLEGDAADSNAQVHAEETSGSGDAIASLSAMAIDQPPDVGATTYKVQYRARAGADNTYMNRPHSTSTAVGVSRGASTMMVQEIMG